MSGSADDAHILRLPFCQTFEAFLPAYGLLNPGLKIFLHNLQEQAQLLFHFPLKFCQLGKLSLDILDVPLKIQELGLSINGLFLPALLHCSLKLLHFIPLSVLGQPLYGNRANFG